MASKLPGWVRFPLLAPATATSGSPMELTITTGIAIAAVSFAAEYVDSSLGMGYGTTLTRCCCSSGSPPWR